ncbi:tetratricopeptide repeat protein [Deferrisoma sp.]
MRRIVATLVLGATLAAAGPAGAVVLAAVDPGWSPFLSAGPVPGKEALWAEAGRTLASDPARVAQVVGREAARADAPARLRGLWADALYLAGGDTLWQAERVFRILVKEDLAPEETAWCWFQLGNIQRIQGFPEAAETSYETALPESREPWRAALRFDLAALALETGRYGRAAELWEAWLRDYPGAEGRATALYLRAESLWRAGEERGALAAFDEARRADPEGWRVRVETARAMADAFRKAERVEEAAALLETLAADRTGTPEGAQALLDVGALWEGRGEVARAAAAYGRLLDGPAPAEAAREARLRLALLGVEHADEVELTEPYPAYRIFYRPRPELEALAAGPDAPTAQRALTGLAALARREGDLPAALRYLERAFRDYPESPESGRAYERFMGWLEAAVGAPGDPAGALLLFERFREAAAWVPTRDLGGLYRDAARAAEAVGAYDRALELYAELRTLPTRAVSPAELEAAEVRVRAKRGEPEAVERWARRRPGDWRALLAWARVEADRGNAEAARKAFQAALAQAPDAAARYRVRVEADRIGRAEADADALLHAWETRRRLWAEIPPPAREGLVAPDPVVGGRLAFASGRFGEAAAELKGATEPVDRLLAALAQARPGEAGADPEVWKGLQESPDPVVAAVARALSGAWELRAAEGKR